VWQTVAHNGRKNADENLALALAAGLTLRESAQAVGISERTASRRWADPGFRRQVSALRGEMVARSLGTMADGMAEAAQVLRGLLGSANESVRLAAARSLLVLGVKLRESVEVEQRLQALEEAKEQESR
jgi:hypothetical protein